MKKTYIRPLVDISIRYSSDASILSHTLYDYNNPDPQGEIEPKAPGRLYI